MNVFNDVRLDWRQTCSFDALNLVVTTYPTAAATRAAMQGAGLDPGSILWSQSLRDIWSDILETADAAGKLASLVEAAGARSAHRARELFTWWSALRREEGLARLPSTDAPDESGEWSTPGPASGLEWFEDAITSSARKRRIDPTRAIDRTNGLIERLGRLWDMEHILSPMELELLFVASHARTLLLLRRMDEGDLVIEDTKAWPELVVTADVVAEIAQGADVGIDLRKPRFRWTVARADLVAALLRMGEVLLLDDPLRAATLPGGWDARPAGRRRVSDWVLDVTVEREAVTYRVRSGPAGETARVSEILRRRQHEVTRAVESILSRAGAGPVDTLVVASAAEAA